MSAARQIAPRVSVYPVGSPSPPVAEGGIVLAQFPQPSEGPVVFGDGSHPTTRLSAAAMDWWCRRLRPNAVLDVGTGTGVLARIARARGSPVVVATDIDPAALACARRDAELDFHPVCIQFGSEAPDHWGHRFDLIVANILEEPLRLLAPSLCRALRFGGTLLLSGFTRLQLPGLRFSYQSAGLAPMSDSALEGWALLRLEHPAPGAPSAH